MNPVTNIVAQIEQIKKGKEFVAQKNFSKAIEVFKQVINNDDNCYAAYIQLGECLRITKKYKESQDAFEKVYPLQKYNCFLLSRLAIVYYEQKEENKAKAFMEQALELSQVDHVAQRYLSLLSLQAKKSHCSTPYPVRSCSGAPSSLPSSNSSPLGSIEQTEIEPSSSNSCPLGSIEQTEIEPSSSNSCPLGSIEQTEIEPSSSNSCPLGSIEQTEIEPSSYNHSINYNYVNSLYLKVMKLEYSSYFLHNQQHLAIIQKYDEILEIDPSHIQSKVWRAMHLLEVTEQTSEEFNLALTYIENVSIENLSRQLLHKMFSSMIVKNKAINKLDQALSHAEKFVAIFPESYLSYYYLAPLLNLKGRYSEAYDAAKKACHFLELAEKNLFTGNTFSNKKIKECIAATYVLLVEITFSLKKENEKMVYIEKALEMNNLTLLQKTNILIYKFSSYLTKDYQKAITVRNELIASFNNNKECIFPILQKEFRYLIGRPYENRFDENILLVLADLFKLDFEKTLEIFETSLKKIFEDNNFYNLLKTQIDTLSFEKIVTIFEMLNNCAQYQLSYKIYLKIRKLSLDTQDIQTQTKEQYISCFENLVLFLKYPELQYELGLMYENGVYLEKDPIEARHFYTLAAKQDHPEALDKLKDLYQHAWKEIDLCEYVDANSDYDDDDETILIIKFCQLAADAGDVQAQSKIGNYHLLYWLELFTDRRLELGLKYCLLAANQGDKLAQLRLGDIHKQLFDDEMSEDYKELSLYYYDLANR